jgi:hypothetical protein
LQKTSADKQVEKELGYNWDGEKNITTNFENRRGTVRLLHRLAKAFDRTYWTKLMQIAK